MELHSFLLVPQLLVFRSVVFTLRDVYLSCMFWGIKGTSLYKERVFDSV